ncbi:hypothetical protein [Microcoleus sp. Pol12A6]|uniref:hypothetical protein n=1 Tax=Microcoleus sp. Pol12A6 TaxID=3055393 RepID=UPI002FCF735C
MTSKLAGGRSDFLPSGFAAPATINFLHFYKRGIEHGSPHYKRGIEDESPHYKPIDFYRILQI